MRTSLEESLLGVKYRILYDEQIEMTEPTKRSGAYAISKNGDALSIGYMIDSEACMNNMVFGRNAFENQNLMARELSGINKDVFVELSPRDYNVSNSRDYVELVEFGVTTTQDSSVWMYVEKAYQKVFYNGRTDTRLYVNGVDFGEFIDEQSDSPFIINLGRYQNGETINISLFSNVEHGMIHVVCFDQKAYDDVIESLKENQLYITKHLSGRFVGTIDSGAGGDMLLTLPYMKGWNIKIDGTEALYGAYRDALIKLHIPEGKHEIDISFISPGFYLGLAVGGISWIIYLLNMLIIVRRKYEGYEKRVKGNFR